MHNKGYFFKLTIATIGAYIASYLVTKTVLYADKPGIRTEFFDQIAKLPQKIAETPQNFTAFVREKIRFPSAEIPQTGGGTDEQPSVYRGPVVFVPPTSILANPNPQPDERRDGGNSPSPSSPDSLPTSPPHPGPSSPPDNPPPQPPTEPTSAPPPAPAPSEQAAAFLELLNTERAKNGASPLYYNASLIKAAQDYANILNTCDHMQGGSTPFQRARAAGYPTSNVGENITCMGRWNAQSAFNGWMGSSLHRSNMLNAQWRGAGLGIGSYGWVLLMGPV